MDSKFIILGQLIPCVSHHKDTCLKSIALLLNKDKNNVSIDFPICQKHAFSDTIIEILIITQNPTCYNVEKMLTKLLTKSVFSRS